jgi:DNA-directed RNA polymerase subunit alpha
MHDVSTYATYNPTFTVTTVSQTDNTAVLAIEPLEQGYGHTLGNALRRVLLSSLPGFSITSVRVDGADHPYTTLEGLTEDIMELVLNLKQVRVKSAGGQAGVMRLSVSGPAEVTAGDIIPEAGFEVVNPKLVIAHVSKGKKLNVEMTVQPGIGYSLATDRKSATLGEIPVDALYSPVGTVSYKVESTRVGRKTDYEKVLLEIKTDGTLTGLEAVMQAAKILARQFTQVFEPVTAAPAGSADSMLSGVSEVMKLTVEELDLPTRIANALRKGGFKTVGDLVGAPKNVIAKVKNLGEKSVDVVDEALQKKGVALGE